VTVSFDPSSLPQWRVAVWALRAGYLALLLVLVGVVALALGASRLLVVIGVIGWLAAASVAVVASLQARGHLTDPRPGLWDLKVALIRDSLHATPSK